MNAKRVMGYDGCVENGFLALSKPRPLNEVHDTEMQTTRGEVKPGRAVNLFLPLALGFLKTLWFFQ